MIRKIKDILLDVFSRMGRWKIAIGRDPRRVPPRTAVIFPLVADTLFCGLAGIMTIRKEGKVKKDDIVEGLGLLFEKIRENNLGKLSNRKTTGEHYLGGDEVLVLMERDILKLKQDSYLEDIFFEPERSKQLEGLFHEMKSFLGDEEKLVELEARNFSTGDMEYVNNALTRFRDYVWALERDIFSNIEMILSLAGETGKGAMSRECFSKYRNINLLLKSLDRLEVRGRDSAGIEVTFALKDEDAPARAAKDIKDQGLDDEWERRLGPGDLVDGSIRISSNTGEKGLTTISFIYKKASVTGKLGENGRYLRERIRSDRLLKIFIEEAIASEMYLGHTRWASVGSITEENCHPINNFTMDPDNETHRSPSFKDYPAYGRGAWTIDVALNG
ncbi:MAG: hypothetical protein E4H39_02210, partial [Syntrophobacterales bacterium]